MAASSDTITITFKAGNAYTFKGTGTTHHRVHPRGHLWLSDDNNPFTATFNIATDGYSFDPNHPIFLAASPNPRKFESENNRFKAALRSAKQLKLTIQNTGETKSYYQLNFVGPNGAFATTDPIIVNR